MKSTYLFVCLMLLAGVFTATARADIAVVVHPACPVSELSRDEVRNIFFGKLRNFPSTDVMVSTFDQPRGSPLFVRLYQHMATLDTAAVNRRRAAYLFSGQGIVPTIVGGDQAMLQRVAQQPQAIGYIDASHVDASVRVVYVFHE